MTVAVEFKILLWIFIFLTKLPFSGGVCRLDSYKQTTTLDNFPMLFKFSSINLPIVQRCLLNFASR